MITHWEKRCYILFLRNPGLHTYLEFLGVPRSPMESRSLLFPPCVLRPYPTTYSHRITSYRCRNVAVFFLYTAVIFRPGLRQNTARLCTVFHRKRSYTDRIFDLEILSQIGTAYYLLWVCRKPSFLLLSIAWAICGGQTKIDKRACLLFILFRRKTMCLHTVYVSSCFHLRRKGPISNQRMRYFVDCLQRVFSTYKKNNTNSILRWSEATLASANNNATFFFVSLQSNFFRYCYTNEHNFEQPCWTMKSKEKLWRICLINLEKKAGILSRRGISSREYSPKKRTKVSQWQLNSNFMISWLFWNIVGSANIEILLATHIKIKQICLYWE
jgi:hypothetical protein